MANFRKKYEDIASAVVDLSTLASSPSLSSGITLNYIGSDAIRVIPSGVLNNTQ